MSTRIVYIHGNGSDTWAFAWAPWLKKELEKLGFETFFELFPDSIIAREKYWLPFLKDRVKVGENDVLVGWSSGGVAAMRYAENNKIKGSVLVAPCYTDLGDEMEKQSGYFSHPWNWENIKKNQEKIALFHGEKDPFIPQNEFEFIADKLKPEVFKIPDTNHFMDLQTFPELLEYIKFNYTAR